MPAQPPTPRHFRWRREASPRIQKIRRQANLPALVGEDCQGGGRPPSLTPRLPSHAPPFPQPAFTLGGGCREGGSSPDFPSCPAALPAGTGRFPHSYRNPQSRPVRTHRPSRSSNLCTAEIASFQAPDVCEASAECASGAHGARPEKRETTRVVSLFSESGPLPETDARPFPGQRASAPIACTSCIPPRARSGCSPLHPPRRACGAGWSCACPPCAPRRQSPRPRSP